MNKIDLILKLVRENKITDEEAKVLMTTEKEYVYQPYPYVWQTSPWQWQSPFTVTSSTAGLVSDSNISTYTA